MRSKMIAHFLVFALTGCGDDDLVGHWRSAQAGDMEFFADGTVTIGKDTPMGARYQQVEGGLQLDQELIGPVTLPLEMMGDSFRVEGRGILGRGALMFYRDSGKVKPVTYSLAGAPAVAGTCVEEQHNLLDHQSPDGTRSKAPPRTEEVRLEAVVTAGELILDPLTRAFTQEIALELRDKDGPQSVSRGRPTRWKGEYREDGKRITLIYRDVRGLTEVEGRREGDAVILPSADFLRILGGPGTSETWSGFHSLAPWHRATWGELPELVFAAAS